MRKILIDYIQSPRLREGTILHYKIQIGKEFTVLSKKPDTRRGEIEYLCLLTNKGKQRFTLGEAAILSVSFPNRLFTVENHRGNRRAITEVAEYKPNSDVLITLSQTIINLGYGYSMVFQNFPRRRMPTVEYRHQYSPFEPPLRLTDSHDSIDIILQAIHKFTHPMPKFGISTIRRLISVFKSVHGIMEFCNIEKVDSPNCFNCALCLLKLWEMKVKYPIEYKETLYSKRWEKVMNSEETFNLVVRMKI